MSKSSVAEQLQPCCRPREARSSRWPVWLLCSQINPAVHRACIQTWIIEGGAVPHLILQVLVSDATYQRQLDGYWGSREMLEASKPFQQCLLVVGTALSTREAWGLRQAAPWSRVFCWINAIWPSRVLSGINAVLPSCLPLPWGFHWFRKGKGESELWPLWSGVARLNLRGKAGSVQRGWLWSQAPRRWSFLCSRDFISCLPDKNVTCSPQKYWVIFYCLKFE